MKTRFAFALLVTTALFGLPLLGCTAEKKEKDSKPKPYPLTTCIVTDETIGADPGMKPYSFVEAGQEVKLCCKACLKDFNKDKAKYMARIEAAQKKPK